MADRKCLTAIQRTSGAMDKVGLRYGQSHCAFGQPGRCVENQKTNGFEPGNAFLNESSKTFRQGWLWHEAVSMEQIEQALLSIVDLQARRWVENGVR